jgi:hypothetical protein
MALMRQRTWRRFVHGVCGFYFFILVLQWILRIVFLVEAYARSGVPDIKADLTHATIQLPGLWTASWAQVEAVQGGLVLSTVLLGLIYMRTAGPQTTRPAKELCEEG